MDSPQTTPFDPAAYTRTGTYLELLRGMEETLRRLHEIDPVTALRLPAYLDEGEAAADRHGVPMFAPSAPWNAEAERDAAGVAAVQIVEALFAAGWDVDTMLEEMQAQMRPGIDAAMVRVRRLLLSGATAQP